MKVLVYKLLSVIIEMASQKLFSFLTRFLNFIFEEEHQFEHGYSEDKNVVIELPSMYIRRVYCE